MTTSSEAECTARLNLTDCPSKSYRPCQWLLAWNARVHGSAAASLTAAQINTTQQHASSDVDPCFVLTRENILSPAAVSYNGLIS